MNTQNQLSIYIRENDSSLSVNLIFSVYLAQLYLKYNLPRWNQTAVTARTWGSGQSDQKEELHRPRRKFHRWPGKQTTFTYSFTYYFIPIAHTSYCTCWFDSTHRGITLLALLWIRFLDKFRSRALSLERGMIFRKLSNEYFKSRWKSSFFVSICLVSDVLCKPKCLGLWSGSGLGFFFRKITRHNLRLTEDVWHQKYGNKKDGFHR